MTRPTRAIVDLDAIASNYFLLARRASPAQVIPVVKADAYGHGAVAVARRLEHEGARRLAVALSEEGIELRNAGIESEILLLSSGDPAEAALLAAQRLVPTLHDAEQVRAMGEAAAGLARPLSVHLKLDTGMGRLGVRPEALAETLARLRSSPGLALSGTFTQLASADEPANPATRRQLGLFADLLEAIRAAGLDPGLVHASNSAAALVIPDARFDAVRAGIALYGVPPSAEVGDPGLAPAMTLETRVLAVKRVPAGTPLGYGGTYVTGRTTTVATLPIGYHDGLRRAFSGRVSVLMGGGRAPIVGAVSMDLTLVDATDCEARPGERAVVLGRLGRDELSAWDLARAAGTIPYEILCGVGARVPRVHVP